MPKATKALRIEKGTVSGNTPFTGLSAAPGPPDTLLRSEPTEAQMEEYRNALILEEQRRKERYSLTSKRWRREQTIWKYVNELAVLFESQVYVVIQHHGEDKKQVYHSAPTKKNWPASFADTYEHDYPVYLRCPETMPPVKGLTSGDADEIPETPSTPVLVECDIPSTSAGESKPELREESSGHQEVATQEAAQRHHDLNRVVLQGPALTWDADNDSHVHLNATGQSCGTGRSQDLTVAAPAFLAPPHGVTCHHAMHAGGVASPADTPGQHMSPLDVPPSAPLPRGASTPWGNDDLRVFHHHSLPPPGAAGPAQRLASALHADGPSLARGLVEDAFQLLPAAQLTGADSKAKWSSGRVHKAQSPVQRRAGGRGRRGRSVGHGRLL